jgi:hypothetical protein
MAEISLINDGDEIGLCFMGQRYQYICVTRIKGINHLQIKQGYFNQDNDIVLFDSIYHDDIIELQMKFSEPGMYKLGFNGIYLKDEYEAYPGRWIGGKVGIYAKGKTLGGYGTFKYFKCKKVK